MVDAREEAFDDAREGGFDDAREGGFDDAREGGFDDAREEAFDEACEGALVDAREEAFDDAREEDFDEGTDKATRDGAGNANLEDVFAEDDCFTIKLLACSDARALAFSAATFRSDSLYFLTRCSSSFANAALCASSAACFATLSSFVIFVFAPTVSNPLLLLLCVISSKGNLFSLGTGCTVAFGFFFLVFLVAAAAGGDLLRLLGAAAAVAAGGGDLLRLLGAAAAGGGDLLRRLGAAAAAAGVVADLGDEGDGDREGFCGAFRVHLPRAHEKVVPPPLERPLKPEFISTYTFTISADFVARLYVKNRPKKFLAKRSSTV